MKILNLIYVILLIGAMLVIACSGDDSPVGPAATDSDKFVGNWAGTYQCTNMPGDTLMIAKGSGELAFKITLHAYTSNSAPEIVDGELTDINVITIPEQTIGGFPGSGKITYANNRLSLSQSGLGLTCKGSNYVKY